MNHPNDANDPLDPLDPFGDITDIPGENPAEETSVPAGNLAEVITNIPGACHFHPRDMIAVVTENHLGEVLGIHLRQLTDEAGDNISGAPEANEINSISDHFCDIANAIAEGPGDDPRHSPRGLAAVHVISEIWDKPYVPQLRFGYLATLADLYGLEIGQFTGSASIEKGAAISNVHGHVLGEVGDVGESITALAAAAKGAKIHADQFAAATAFDDLPPAAGLDLERALADAKANHEAIHVNGVDGDDADSGDGPFSGHVAAGLRRHYQDWLNLLNGLADGKITPDEALSSTKQVTRMLTMLQCPPLTMLAIKSSNQGDGAKIGEVWFKLSRMIEGRPRAEAGAIWALGRLRAGDRGAVHDYYEKDGNALNSPFSQAMLGVIMTDDIEGLIKMVYDGGDQILAELYPRPGAGHESIDDGL